MEKGIRICKVCGCEYPYCKTLGRTDRFRYQDVACCPEHAAIYFQQIEESRNGEAKQEDFHVTMVNEHDFMGCCVCDTNDCIDQLDDEENEDDFEEEEEDLDTEDETGW